jgi:uncharacterized protein YkwD
MMADSQAFQRRMIGFLWLVLLVSPLRSLAEVSSLSHEGALTGQSPPPVLTSSSLAVNPTVREEVVQFYKTVYLAGQNVAMNWNGNVTNCSAGSTSAEFAAAIIQRVNYFRAMAHLPGDVTLNTSWSAKCQQAALMMAAEGRLSHTPASGWKCYTTEGAEAAQNSNLYHGRSDPGVIDGYMDDYGAINYFVGHRRWILYPPQKVMGNGSIPTTGGKLGANALWVTGGSGARPAAPEWVAWPAPGYMPYQIMPRVSKRWSFSFPGANFSQTTVTMSSAGTNIPVALEALENDHAYADNTVVWVANSAAFSNGADDKTYELVIENVLIGGSARSFNYRVTVIDPDRITEDQPPIIVEHPQSSTVHVGGSVHLHVAASGTPPLNYEWLREGVPIAGAYGDSLNITNAQPADAGTYEVVVRNTVGEARSTSAEIVVLQPPVIVESPADQAGPVGAQVVFQVRAAGTEPLEFFWRHQGQILTGATQSILILSPLTKSLEGLYDVVVRNVAGAMTSAPARLEVWEPPVITLQPESQTVRAGDPAVLQVAAAGSTPFNYEWRRNGITVTAVNSDSLQIQSAQATDAGSYEVVVRNIAGEAKSAPAELVVVEPTTIVISPLVQNIEEGGSAEIRAVVTGTAPFELQWRFNSQPLPGETNSAFEIEMVNSSHAGAYDLLVRNIVGETISEQAILNVVPVEPFFLRIATLPGNRVRIEWEGSMLLQESATVNGWADKPQAQSPYETEASENQKFYRLKRAIP